MSSRSMSLDVLVRLRDKLSGPLRGLRAQLEKLAAFGRKLGLLGAAIAAISFMGPIKEAAAFQQKLLDIASTAELSGKAAFKFVDEARAKYEALALASGQASDTIAQGAGQMTAAGLDASLIDASIGDIARASTAANAQFSDMADVATSLMQTLKVPAAELKDAMGALVVSGKLGAFEMKDMAKYFPTLTSQMTKFGIKGREAVNFLGAALQIARKGTSDPAEAANNLKNFLSKVLAPATIKNFKDAGIDIQGVMKDAATKGINPIEAVVQKISNLTGASGKEISQMMANATKNGLTGADALASVREQLEKIHGAGKLGEIFADQQVMDFLIPMLANIDEYKKIKAEVAKATGGIIDTDFETQMAGLNRQLGLFNEIGTQAAREVGFAFGSWLPEINDMLAKGLKWYRDWNKESGGLGTKLLSIAGGGVILATAFGALGVALPVIAAGFAALGALLSPIGVLIGAVALAGMHIYKNWGTYGPRLVRLWDSAKRGFLSFVDGLRDRGRRLIDAGREIFNQFGPRIAAGLNSAWSDIKAGWSNIKGMFQEIAKAAGLKFDLSGISIDSVKLGLIKTLEGALKGISAAWNALKDFGSGFALHLPAIGEDIGRTIKAFADIGNSLWRIGRAVAQLAGLDTAKFDGFFKTLGDWAGKAAAWQFGWIRTLAEGIAAVTKAIADFAEGKPIDWNSLIPKGVQEAWTPIKDAIEPVLNMLRKLFDLVTKGIPWGNLLPSSVVSTMVDGWNKVAGAINAVADAFNRLPSISMSSPAVSNQTALDNATRAAASKSSLINHNTTDTLPGKTKDDITSSNDNRFVPAASKQRVDVGGSVVIKVIGPGQVSSATSTNKDVKLVTSNTGRVVGRV